MVPYSLQEALERRGVAEAKRRHRPRVVLVEAVIDPVQEPTDAMCPGYLQRRVRRSEPPCYLAAVAVHGMLHLQSCGCGNPCCYDSLVEQREVQDRLHGLPYLYADLHLCYFFILLFYEYYQNSMYI